MPLSRSTTLPFPTRYPCAEIRNCRAINTRSTQSSEDGNFRPIEKLQLAFTHLDKNKPDVVFDFYNATNDYSLLNGELQLMEKWQKIANDKLTSLSSNR